jgi:hypothetical protein
MTRSRHRRPRSPLALPRLPLPRLAAAGVVSAVGLALTAGGVYAALNATASNTTPQSDASGTLKLVLADNGAGFTTAVSALAPGDTVNRFVNLTNSGTLDASGLTLGVADTVNSKLTTDATNGLKVTVSSCSVAWAPTTGVCSGTTTTLVSSAALATIKSTPATLSSSAVPAGTTTYLRVALNLPDQAETTVNGTLPTGTIQNLTASLTWTFTETQRAATTTTS